MRPETKEIEEQQIALNMASDLADSRIGEKDVIRTNHSRMQDSVLKMSK
jgi:hypothetical protein